MSRAGEHQAVTLSTQKRCSIKSLPNHLVIHLKRFDFDFDTMQQTKARTTIRYVLTLLELNFKVCIEFSAESRIES